MTSRLFENMEPAPLATAPTETVTVDTWGDVVGLAQETSLANYSVIVRNPGPGPIREPELGASVASSTQPAVTVQSPVQVTVHVTSPSQHLVVAEPFDSSWSANGRPAQEELGALAAFDNVPAGTVDVTYGRWPVVRDFYVASGAVVLVLLALLAVPAFRRRRRPPEHASVPDAFNAPVEPLSEPVLQHSR